MIGGTYGQYVAVVRYHVTRLYGAFGYLRKAQ